MSLSAQNPPTSAFSNLSSDAVVMSVVAPASDSQSEASTWIQVSPTEGIWVEGSLRCLSPPKSGRKFKGIRRRKWGKVVSEIRGAQGKRIWLGSYDTEEEAARVYDEAARILQGSRAWLNFPQEKAGTVQLSKVTVETLKEHRELMQLKKRGTANQNRLRASLSSSSDESFSDASPDAVHPASSAQSPDSCNSTEWDSLLMSLQDPTAYVWVKGVGPISPSASSDQSGAGHVDLIPELSLDFDCEISSAAPASSLQACSSDSNGAGSPRGDYMEEWLDMPPLCLDGGVFTWDADALGF